MFLRRDSSLQQICTFLPLATSSEMVASWTDLSTRHVQLLSSLEISRVAKLRREFRLQVFQAFRPEVPGRRFDRYRKTSFEAIFREYPWLVARVPEADSLPPYHLLQMNNFIRHCSRPTANLSRPFQLASIPLPVAISPPPTNIIFSTRVNQFTREPCTL